MAGVRREPFRKVGFDLYQPAAGGFGFPGGNLDEPALERDSDQLRRSNSEVRKPPKAPIAKTGTSSGGAALRSRWRSAGAQISGAPRTTLGFAIAATGLKSIGFCWSSHPKKACKMARRLETVCGSTQHRRRRRANLLPLAR